ncbi:hypothetical protein [Bradyrhizobium sp. LB11.1]|uniref:hypothetical protein n=1 Tax=Bradyrhizobium sp. LB11.1 TaxID=3156326 RepID=UPI003393E531
MPSIMISGRRINADIGTNLEANRHTFAKYLVISARYIDLMAEGEHLGSNLLREPLRSVRNQCAVGRDGGTRAGD